MLSETPLPEPQMRQLGQMLAKLIAGGAGELEIVVERSRVRRLKPGLTIYNPHDTWYPPMADSCQISVEELIGDKWWPAFAARLRELIGHGWGSLTIRIDHHQIQAISYIPDVWAVDARPLVQ